MIWRENWNEFWTDRHQQPSNQSVKIVKMNYVIIMRQVQRHGFVITRSAMPMLKKWIEQDPSMRSVEEMVINLPSWFQKNKTITPRHLHKAFKSYDHPW